MSPLLALLVMATELPAPLLVDQVDFAAQPGEAPPSGPEVRWSRVSLPDRWRERQPTLGGPGWYRFQLSGRAFSTELLAIYLADVNMNAAVFINGKLVGVDGEMDGDIGNNWNRPLLFQFPAGVLHSGNNEIVVQVQARAHAFGGLGPVLVGPVGLLAQRFERRLFLRVSLSRVGTFIAAWLFLWAGAMWLGTRRDPMFGCFAAAMLCFALFSLNYHVRDLPVPRGAWEWLVNVALDAFAVACLAFVHRLLGLRFQLRERVWVAALALVALAMALVPDRLFYPVAHVGHLLGASAGGLALWVVWSRRTLLSRFEALSGQAGALSATALGLYDLLIQLRVLDQERTRLLPHAIAVCILTFGTILVIRFLRALEAGRRHNLELRRAVQQREAELAAQFERVRAFEREQLLVAERARIMREVHDGVGGHIASTLALAQHSSFSCEEMVDALRLVREELSLLIDALDPTLDDLPSLLAVLRGRIEPRLARSGIQFDWQVSDAPLEGRLQPQQVHQCMRIVQEAISNVIKHARARTIVVRTGAEQEGLVLEIRDDGGGLGPGRAGGRGLTNMQHRARELGGRLSVTAANPGTSVVLWLPLPGRSVVQPDQSQMDGFVDRGRPRVDLELPVQIAHVGGDRVSRESQ